MVCKFLEKRIEVLSGENNQSSGNSIELEYYLLEKSCEENDGIDYRKSYGIEILKKHQDAKNERKQYEDIFVTREQTECLLERLARNAVTPMSLPYILDDLIGI